ACLPVGDGVDVYARTVYPMAHRCPVIVFKTAPAGATGASFDRATPDRGDDRPLVQEADVPQADDVVGQVAEHGDTDGRGVHLPHVASLGDKAQAESLPRCDVARFALG